MNKKMICTLCAMATLTAAVGALMIGCGSETDKPAGSFASTQGSDTQTTDNSMNTSATDWTGDTTVQDPMLEETGNIDVADPSDPTVGTGSEPVIEVPLPPGVDVSVGVVEGAGSTDLDDTPGLSGSVSTDNPKPTESAKPTEATKPTQTGNDPLGKDFDVTLLTYEAYHAMTGEQQQAVIDLFSTPNDFVKWYKALEAQYKAEHPDVEIGSNGMVDLNP